MNRRIAVIFKRRTHLDCVPFLVEGIFAGSIISDKDEDKGFEDERRIGQDWEKENRLSACSSYFLLLSACASYLLRFAVRV